MFLLGLVLYGGCCGRCGEGRAAGTSSGEGGCGRSAPCGAASQAASASCCCRRRRCCTGYGAASGVCGDECYYIRQYALCGCNCDNG